MRRLILLLLLPIFSFAQTRQSGGISFTPQYNYKISGSDTTWQFGNTLMSPQQFPFILTKWQSDQRYAPITGGVYKLKNDTVNAQGYARNWQLTNLLAGKANIATTLAGYGITDAYTKTASDARFAPIAINGTVTSLTDNTANGVAITWANRTTTPTPTVVLGAITPTSTNGVSAATMAFNDATSSIQTQLNGKAPSVTYTSNTIYKGNGTTTPVVSHITDDGTYIRAWDGTRGIKIGGSSLFGGGMIWDASVGTPGDTNFSLMTQSGSTTLNSTGNLYFSQLGTTYGELNNVGFSIDGVLEATSYPAGVAGTDRILVQGTSGGNFGSPVKSIAANYYQTALGFTPENVANKATAYTTVNNTLYPTIQLMRDSTLHPNKNLSDVTNKPTALTNLGAAAVGQTMYIGTTAHALNRTSASEALTGITSIDGSAAKWTTGRTLSITGDIAYTSPSIDGSGNVTAAATLPTVNSNVGSFGSSTSIPTFAVNAKGLITAASGNVVIAPAGTLTGTTLASNVVTSSLTSAAGGSFGSNAYTSTSYLPASGFTTSAINTLYGYTPANGANYLPLSAGTANPLTGVLQLNVTGNNQIALNSTGSQYGYLMNPSANNWALGYGTTVGTLGTSVLAWDSAGVSITGTASVSGALSASNLSGTNTGDNSPNSLYSGLVTMTYPGAGIPVSTGSAWGSSITNNSTNWNTAFSQTRQWDGGSTGLVAATGRASLGLVIGTDVLAQRTFGTAANNNTGDFEVPLTFSTGLTRSTNTITVNYGTSSTTAAVGNDSRINNGQTAFGWGNPSGVYLPLAAGIGNPITGKLYHTANQNYLDASPITGTTSIYQLLHNTGGQGVFGVDNSTGTDILATGGIAYSTNLATNNATSLVLGTNQLKALVIDVSQNAQFYGNVRAITPSANDNSTKVATTAYVDAAVAGFVPNSAQTTVSGSVSGSIVASMPFSGSSYKKVLIYINTMSGTATYTFPTAFSIAPTTFQPNGGSAGTTFSVTTTSVIVTSAAGFNGFVTLEGY